MLRPWMVAQVVVVLDALLPTAVQLNLLLLVALS
jgi:hypothetical protein